MIRYAVMLPDQPEGRRWVGRNKGSTWSDGKAVPSYDNVPQRNAVLYVQRAAATKAAQSIGHGVVVEVTLHFGATQ